MPAEPPAIRKEKTFCFHKKTPFTQIGAISGATDYALPVLLIRRTFVCPQVLLAGNDCPQITQIAP
jgi:hypothetical protein